MEDVSKQKSSKSMFRAYREKKAAKLHHASNYQTGFIDIREHHLHRTGIRGRKRTCTWCCVAVLLLISLANLVLNLVLIAFLQLSPSGLPYMMFDTKNNVIFPQTTNISALESAGVLSSYHNRSLSLQSPMFDIHAGSERLQSSTGHTLNSSQILMDSSGVTMKPYSQFKLVHLVSVHEDDMQQSLTDAAMDVLTINSSGAWFSPPLYSDQLHSDRIVTTSVTTDHVKIECNALEEDECNIRTKEALALTSSDSITLSSLNEDIRFTLKQQNDHHLVITREKDNGSLTLVLPRLKESNVGTSGTGTRLCMCENGRVFKSTGGNCLIQPNEFSNPCKH